jgi:beta-lactamase class A
MNSFFQTDSTLANLGQKVITETCQQFSTLTPEDMALTWLVYYPPVMVNTGGAITPEEFWRYPVKGFTHRGDQRIYPASIVKLFYLVALQEWLNQGMTNSNPELDRAMTDMIRDSSNDATSLIVDVLTGTTSGPELPPQPFETWKNQRNIVNRYYQSLNWPELSQININQKTWGDGAYGRERAFVGPMLDNRNMLTTNATARLLHSIVGGVAVSGDRSQTMLDLLRRDRQLGDIPPENGEENQVNGFLGEGLPPNAKLWSKAGWTSTTRHDAAYIELPDHPPYLLTVFTTGKENAHNRDLLPFISQQIVSTMAAID